MMRRVLPFLGSEFPPVSREQAYFEIIPAPMEVSVSYGRGAAGGPAAILAASQQLDPLEEGSCPGAVGIYTGMTVSCRGSAAAILKRIEGRVFEAIRGRRVPVVLGGEHTVTLGAIRALHRAGQRLGILQLDAHADLRDCYEGNPYSHACVMRRAVEETGVPLMQLGVRTVCEEEVAFRRERAIGHRDAAVLERFPGYWWRPLPVDFPEALYLTVDVDGLDPSVIPATGTPVPGGLRWSEALALLWALSAGRRVIGFDVVELAPRRGDRVSDFAAARLVYSLMRLCLRTKRDFEIEVRVGKWYS